MVVNICQLSTCTCSAGIFDTATTSIFDFNMSNNTTTTVNDTLLVIAPLLLPVEDGFPSIWGFMLLDLLGFYRLSLCFLDSTGR